MKRFKPTSIVLFALVIVAGCASSEVTSRRSEQFPENIPRPARIIVYDFAATPADIPPQSTMASRHGHRPALQTSDQIALGRELGGRVAQRLVNDILKMGLPAERAGGPPPQDGNIIINGGFISVDEGRGLERVIIGFGAGANKMRTYVGGYLVTPSGWKPLDSAEIKAGGGKTPGMILPAVIGIVTGEYIRSAIIGGALALYKETGPEKITATPGAALSPRRRCRSMGQPLSMKGRSPMRTQAPDFASCARCSRSIEPAAVPSGAPPSTAAKRSHSR